MTSAWLWLFACAGPDPVGGAVVGLQVDTRAVGSGAGLQIEVQVAGPHATPWELEVPTPPGVTFGEPTERKERAGDLSVVTRRYAVQADVGSFIVEGVCATGASGPPSCATPLYVDLGPPPARDGMMDIIEPAALWPLPPAWLVAAVTGLALVAGLALRAWRRRPAPVILPPPPEPAHSAALRRWEAVRGDRSLSDHEKALALSEIFRDYTEQALQFPARSWTTSQTLAHLESLTFLPRENLPRARKLLRATDRVKYAEARPGTDFFEELDADLRAFVDSTRPRAWEER